MKYSLSKFWLLSIGAICLISSLLATMALKKSKKPNVLFICVDDLRPELNVYGNSQIHSPNMDALAKNGFLFNNQFVTQPTCGASRYSLLTGKRPTDKRQLQNSAIETFISGQPKTNVPETFIDQLRRKGYYTVGIGKISHSVDGYLYGYEEPVGDQLELPQSWDEMLFNAGKWKTGWNAFFAYADGSNRQSKKKQVKPYEAGEVDDNGYPDGLTAELAIKKLGELAKRDEPFCLSVGFFKPHLPFNAPKKYWDLYDESKIELTPSPNIPDHVHKASLQNSGEFNGYELGEEKAALDAPVSDAYARKIKHAYYAAVSYSDAQIGKVLAELKRLKLEDDTIVVLWGDHGWHLGDDRVWGKHTNFEVALRSALIVKVPGQKGGIIRDQVVSSIDIYPTLMKLCGINVNHALDGKSFDQLLTRQKVDNWDNLAYSYYNNGISMRNDRYRLTKYFRNQQPVTELYDHQTDPHENFNIAAKNPDLVAKLTKEWEKGNTGLFEK